MDISAPKGAVKRRKVLGRGPGTGKGCTAGRGTKGQKSRSGYSRTISFEGGQMPLLRRVPKRGFNNRKFQKLYQAVNICELNRYKNGDRVDFNLLLKDGLVTRKSKYVKILGKGELRKKLTVVVDKISTQEIKRINKVSEPVWTNVPSSLWWKYVWAQAHVNNIRL